MGKIVLTIDCEPERCGKCKCRGEVEGMDWCGAFGERLTYDPESKDFMRLPLCLDAESTFREIW